MRILGKHLNDLLESSGQKRTPKDSQYYMMEVNPLGSTRFITYEEWLEKYCTLNPKTIGLVNENK